MKTNGWTRAEREALKNALIERVGGTKIKEVSEFIKTIPETKVIGYIRAINKLVGNKAAIKAKCFECSNYQTEEITHCNVVTCPLYEYRPLQKK